MTFARTIESPPGSQDILFLAPTLPLSMLSMLYAFTYKIRSFEGLA